MRMGATAAVNVSRDTLEEVMHKQGLVEGFDVGLEMSGSAAALSQLILQMRNGGKVALLGLFSQETKVDWNEIILKGLTLQGIYGRRMFETWYKMSAIIQSGLDLAPLITHRFHYTQFQNAFDIMSTGKSGKIILDWGTTK